MEELHSGAGFSAVVGAEPGRVVFTLRGDLDAMNAATFTQAVRATAIADRHVVVDLAGVNVVGALGLAALLGVRRHAARQGGMLTLRSPPRALLRMIETSGYADELCVLSSDDDDRVFEVQGLIDDKPATLHWIGGLCGSDVAVTRARLLADLGVAVGTGPDRALVAANTAEGFPGGFLTALAAFDTVTEAWFDIPTAISDHDDVRRSSRGEP